MKKNIQIVILLFAISLSASAQLANWSAGPKPEHTDFPTFASVQINGICRIVQFKFHPTDIIKKPPS